MNNKELFKLSVVPLLKNAQSESDLTVSRFSHSNLHTLHPRQTEHSITFNMDLDMPFPLPEMLFSSTLQVTNFSNFSPHVAFSQQSVSYFPQVSLLIFSLHMHKTQNIPPFSVVLHACRLLFLDNESLLIHLCIWILQYIEIYVFTTHINEK